MLKLALWSLTGKVERRQSVKFLSTAVADPVLYTVCLNIFSVGMVRWYSHWLDVLKISPIHTDSCTLSWKVFI